MIGLKMVRTVRDSTEHKVTIVLPSSDLKTHAVEFDNWLLEFKVISKRNTLKVGRRNNKRQTDFILYNTEFNHVIARPSGARWQDLPSAHALSIMGNNFVALPGSNRGLTIFCVWNRMRSLLAVMVNPSEYSNRDFTFSTKKDYGEGRIILKNVERGSLPRLYELLYESIKESKIEDKKAVKIEKEKVDG